MGKEQRLTKNRQYSAVYQEGHTWLDPLVVLRARPNGLEISRFGFVVSKRLGKAVARNRIKRLLREIARSVPTRPGWDLVLVARTQAAKSDYHRLRAGVERLLLRARLLENRMPPRVQGASGEEG